MTTFGELFLSMKADPRTLRKSVADAVKTGDAQAAGARAGQGFSQGMRTSILKHANMITGALAGGALVAAGASVKMAIGFQESLTTLVTGAGVAEKDIGKVGEGIKRIAILTGTTTDQLVKGEYMIASAGFTGASSLKVLQAAAEGAKTGNADLGTVADAVTTVLKDYHLGADKAAASTSALVVTVSRGKTHLQDLASSLGRVLPTASALGISYAQVGGALATMTARGTSARLASMGLNATMLALAVPTAAAAKGMNLLGLSERDSVRYAKAVEAGHAGLAKKILATGTASNQVTAALQKHGLIAALQMVSDLALKAGPRGSAAYVAAMKLMLGGTNGLRVGLQLTGKNMTDLVANTRAIAKSSGDAKGQVTGFAKVQQDAAFKMAHFKEEAQVAGITLGQKLLPAITGVMDFVSTHSGLVIGLAAGLAGVAVSISVVSKAWGAYKAIAAGVAAVQALCTDAALGTRIELWLLRGQEIICAAAAKGMAAAQWLLNVAMDANPIGLIVIALAALAAGFVYAWTHSATFRKIVIGAFHDVLAVVMDVWHWIQHNWPLLVGILGGPIGVAVVLMITHWHDLQKVVRIVWDDIKLRTLQAVDKILQAFARIPFIGSQFEKAHKAVSKWIAAIQADIDRLNGKTVSVNINLLAGRGGKAFVGNFGRGGRLPGWGGGDILPILAEPGEAVVEKHTARANADILAAMGVPGFRAGGLVFGERTHVTPQATADRRITRAMLASVQRGLARLGAGLGGGAAGSGVQRWRPDVLAALGMLGLPSTDAGLVLYQMQTESGGNPRAINLWDANARAGTPSKGLMQVIGPTFARWRSFLLPDDIYNPMANIFAALNYAEHGRGIGTGPGQLGSGHGYGDGGIIDEPILGVGLRTGGLFAFGEKGRREHVTPEGRLEGLLAELIDAVRQSAPDIAYGVASALDGVSRRSAHRAMYSASG